MSAPSRILLVRLSHLGDVVHALCVYHALRAAWPSAELAWAIQPEFAELVEPLPGVVRTLRFGRRDGWRAWPRLWREARAFAPELAVDAQGNVKSALVVLGSGARRRAGLARRDWREPLAAGVLDDPAPPAEARPAHAMHRMLALARHVAPGVAAPELHPVPTPAETARGHRELARRSLDPRRTVLVGVKPACDVRGWPTARWAELARGLAADGRAVLVVAGPGAEREGAALAVELADERRVAVWPDQRGLRELCGLFAAAAALDVPYVGCDSGPLHLAAACGVRTVCLEGPQDAARTGPWPLGADGPHRVVRARARPACAPCLARRCTHAEGAVCMSGIDPRDVREVLAAPAPAGSPSTAR